METQQTILLAEDNPDDVRLIRLAFAKAGFDHPIQVVRNGAEAIQYLRGEGRYAHREIFPVPAVLLLDLKMPLVTGFDVLTWVRKHAEWKCLPVIVLTTSFYGPDINKAYDLGANSFVTKAVELDEFVGVIRQLGKFWLYETRLPTPGPFVPAPAESANGNGAGPVVEEAWPPGHRNVAPTESRKPTAPKGDPPIHKA